MFDLGISSFETNIHALHIGLEKGGSISKEILRSRDTPYDVIAQLSFVISTLSLEFIFMCCQVTDIAQRTELGFEAGDIFSLFVEFSLPVEEDVRYMTCKE